jgi:hypothetical protein
MRRTGLLLDEAEEYAMFARTLKVKGWVGGGGCGLSFDKLFKDI